MRVWILTALLALTACDQAGVSTKDGEGGAAGARPNLVAPAPDAEPARAFTPTNDAARALSGARLTISVVTQLADADNPSASPTEVISLRGENGFALDGQLTGQAAPSMTVESDTLRALMRLGVDASQTLVYRVTNAHGAICAGADAPANIVVWEPQGPGDAVLKVLPITGGAPGQASAHACPALEFRRA
ncbi:MAG: hypothetical protein AB7L65_04870 [Hyphomonadaceae bacterium]